MAVLKALVGLVLLPAVVDDQNLVPVTPIGMNWPGSSVILNGVAAAPVFASVIGRVSDCCQSTVALIGWASR